jgi:hypothetical protein
MVLGELFAMHSENYMNSLYGEHEELSNVKTGGCMDVHEM